MNIQWSTADELFIADIPELPGCMAHGASRVEAVMRAEEAVALWLKTAAEDGLPAHNSSSPCQELKAGMEADEAEFVSLTAEDVIAQAKARKMARGSSQYR